MMLINAINTPATLNAFEQLANKFLNDIQVSEATLKTYKQNLKPFFKYLAARNITAPTKGDLIAYIQYLQVAGKKPATIKSYFAAVKVLFTWLESEGIIKDVARYVKTPKVSAEHKSDYLEKEQVAKLIEFTAAAGDKNANRDALIIELAVSNGLRTIELSRANIGDLRVCTNGKYLLTIHGKGGTDKTARIPDQLGAKLVHYIKSSRPDVNAQSPLFLATASTNNKGRIIANSFSRIIAHRMTAAGIKTPRITAHSLRHTAAVQALKATNFNIYKVQNFMRHASPTTTQIYLNEYEQASDTISNDLYDVFTKAI